MSLQIRGIARYVDFGALTIGRLDAGIFTAPIGPNKKSFAKPYVMDSILVVEDEQIILELITDVLEMYGYKVRAFSNADTAWEYISAHHYPPRLLITDLRMPGDMDGVELVKRVQSIQPQTPIVVASGHHGDSELLNDPKVFWLPKPFNIDKLHEVCQKLAPLP